MKLYHLIFLVLIFTFPSFSQTDTIYFNPISGNYLIQYIGVTENGRDTLITFEFEPATKIDPIIQSFVVKTPQGKFLYRYKITNGVQAKQNLNEFSLHYDSTIWIESRTPETSWKNYNVKMHDYSGHSNSTGEGKLVYTWIWHGDQGLEATWFIDSCMIVSNGLPSITDSYSQAVHHILVWPADQKDNSKIDINSELGHLDVYPINNVLRRTICPILPPSSFVPLNFLDTLSIYTTQSLSLGWIKDQTTANKYLEYFTSAKTNLQQNMNKPAWLTLKKVLHDVDIDSTSLPATVGKLTSEAYALLRYNTEYLLSQLPTPPPSYSLTVKTNGQGSVTLNPNQTEFDSASVVQLTATPQQNCSFKGWSGDIVSSSNPLSLTINSNKTVTATFSKIVIPSLPAALTIISPTASGAFSGDNFLITGKDYALNGTPTTGQAVHGIVTTTTQARQGILNGLQSFQKDNINGSGGATSDIAQQTLSFDAKSLIDTVLKYVEKTIPTNVSGTYGTETQPMIVQAKQGIQSSGNVTGAGILIVDGPFMVSGQMDWMGIIIHRNSSTVGAALSVSTKLSVIGGMIMYNTGPFPASIQVSNQLTIKASAEALEMLRLKLK